MCGLYGWQLTRKTPALNVVNGVLAQAMSARGTDSWGVIADGKVKRGLDSITYAPITPHLPEYQTVAAHTRYGTTGKITEKNAHPFTIGNIIGMHNGIIDNHHMLSSRYGRAFAVDSQHIFAHIDEGLDLSDIIGYGAIVYTTTADKETLYLGKFNDGELAVARVSDKAGSLGVMWASTYSALKGACALAGLRAKFYNIVDGTLYRIRNGRLSIVDNSLTVTDIPKQKTVYVPTTWKDGATTWRTTPMSKSYGGIYDIDGNVIDDEEDEHYSDRCDMCDELPGEECVCDVCRCDACERFYYHDWMRSYQDADEKETETVE